MKDIYKDQGIMDDESMMMVGIIDLFYENKDGDIILLDYKTDYVGDRSDQDLIDRYKVHHGVNLPDNLFSYRSIIFIAKTNHI